MDAAPVFVGIDVGNASRDLAVRPSGQQERLTNDEEGIAQLSERLQAIHPVLVVLEATGGLNVPVTAAVVTAGLAVAVVTPRQVRAVAKATGHLAKTDARDAHLLARVAADGPPHAAPTA